MNADQPPRESDHVVVQGVLEGTWLVRVVGLKDVKTLVGETGSAQLFCYEVTRFSFTRRPRFLILIQVRGQVDRWLSPRHEQGLRIGSGRPRPGTKPLLRRW